MSDDSSFIVEILLKAVDQASPAIRSLNKAVDDLKAKSAAGAGTSELSKGIDDVGDSAEDAERDLRSHRQELERHEPVQKRTTRAAQEHTGATKEQADAYAEAAGRVGEHRKQLEDYTRTTQQQDRAEAQAAARREAAARKEIQTNNELQNSIAAVASKYREVSNSRGLSGDDRERALKQIQAEAAKNARKTDIGSPEWRQMSRIQTGTSTDLKQMADAARAAVNLRQETDRSSSSTSELNERVAALSGEYKNLAATTQDLPLAQQRRAFQQIAQEASGLTRQLERGTEQWRMMAQISDEAGRTSKAFGGADDAERMLRRYADFNELVKSGSVTASAAKDSYKDFASAFDTLRDNIDKGSESWKMFGRLIDDATRKANNAKTAVTGGGFLSGVLGNLKSAVTGGGLGDLDMAMRNLQAHVDGVGVQVVSLSAKLRGLVLVGAVGFIQQLDSALVGLVGGFFAVGSAAVQAAATIGGTFIAAMGQAIPTVAVFADALSRLKVVMNAVSAAQALQQQTATQGLTTQIDQLSATNSVISSQQALANSYTQVKDAQDELTLSQQNLTVARLDAQRQIQDLMFAEQQAELQEKGANITMQEAQQNLQQTILSGGTGTALESAQLQVQQARLGQRQARVAVPRARYDADLARRQGVEGSPSVEAARQSVTQASQGLSQATQSVGAASRALKIAELQATQSNSSIATAANTLKYYLGLMTPAERSIYETLEKLAQYFKDPNSPFNKIGDYIVAPIGAALNRVYEMLKDPAFIGAFDKLGKSIGGALNGVLNQLTGSQGKGFLEDMAADAAKNVPIIGNSFQQLIKMFEDLAKAAAPALHTLIVDFNNVVKALAHKWGTPDGASALMRFFNDGVAYLKDFYHWLGAVGDLLMALGHQAAPVGGNLLQGWTDSLDRMTKWVDAHGKEVNGFFVDMGHALDAVGQILGTIGLGMIKLAGSGGLSSLASAFRVLIPIVVDAGRVLGALTDAFTYLVGHVAGVRQLLEILGTTALVAISLGKLYTVLRGIALLFAGLKDGGVALFTGLKDKDGIVVSLKAARDAVAERLDAEKGITANLADQLALLKEQTVVMAGLSSETAERDAAGALGAGETMSAGGVILPAGAAAAGAAETAAAGDAPEIAAGAAGAAGAGGMLGGLSAYILPVGGALLAGSIFNNLTNKASTGTTGTGLGSEITGVGGTHFDNSGILGTGIGPTVNPFGFFGLNKSNNSGSTTTELKSLQNSLNGITNPAQLSTTKLKALYDQTEKILQQGDITAGQRTGLEKLQSQLDPTNVALDKTKAKLVALDNEWMSTFSGINETTGSVMAQVKQTLSQDIANINTNLGSGTKEGAQALSATITGAWSTILQNTSAAARGTGAGLKAISTMFDQALKSLGITNIPKNLATFKTFKAADSLVQSGFSGDLAGDLASSIGQGASAYENAKFATGGIPTLNRPTGNVINQPTYITGEEAPTHKEYVIATNPAYRERNQGLLMSAGRDLGMPGFAQGGVISFADAEGLWDQAGGPKSVAAIAAAIADAESSLRPGIIQAGQPYGSTGWGLWQITPGDSEPQYGVDNAMLVGINNARAAVAKFRGAGDSFRPWTTFMDGAYRQFLQGDVAAASSSALASLGSGVSSLLKAPKIKTGAGMAKTIGQNVLDMTTNAANAVLSSMGMSSGMITMHTSSARGGASAAGAGLDTSATSVPSGSFGVPGDSWNPERKPIANWIVPILRWAATHGWSGSVDSGYRSYAEQLYLYDHAGQDGISTIVAKPGTSNHEKTIYPGGAVDVDGGSDSQLISVLRGYKGSQQLIGGYLGPADPYHFSADGRRTGGVIYAANGYSGTVDKPTKFVAGEAGKEDVHIVPHYKTGGVSTLGNTLDSYAASISGVSLSNPNPLNLPPGAAGTVSGLSDVLQVLLQTFNKLKPSASGFQASFLSLVDSIVNPQTGVLARLDAAFTVMQNTINTALVIGGRQAGVGMSSAQRGYLRGITGEYSTSPSGFVRERASVQPAEADQQQVTGLERQTKYIQGEEGIADRTLGRVSKQVAAMRAKAQTDPKKYDKALQALTGVYNSLIQKIQGYTSAIAQNITNTYDAETQKVQDQLTALSDSYGTAQTVLQNKQGTLENKGNYGAAVGIDTQLAQSSLAELKPLNQALKAAQATGDTDLVAQIKQQMSQLKATAAQAAVQALSDAQQAIDQAATTQQAGIQSKQSIAQSMGDYTDSSFDDKLMARAASQQAAQLQFLMQQAQSKGDTGLASQIQQEIDTLQSTVAQMTAQMISDQISAIQQTAQTVGAQVSEQQSIAQTMQSAANSPAQFAAAGAMNASALNLNQNSLLSQQSQYETLLSSANTSGNVGAAATIQQTLDQLATEIATNTQAISDNTAETVQNTASYTQSRGQFATGVYGGLSQLLQTVGQTTGVTDVAAEQGLVTSSNKSLYGTNSNLLSSLGQLGGGAASIASALNGVTDPSQFASILGGADITGAESGQSATWVSTFEGIINSLETNTEAIATNNQQLATLNGSLLQPQTWASMTWTSFRTAVFNGMGGLLPGYANTLTGSAAPTTPAQAYSPIASGSVTPTIGTLNLTSPVQNVDTGVLGANLYHELSTTPA